MIRVLIILLEFLVANHRNHLLTNSWKGTYSKDVVWLTWGWLENWFRNWSGTKGGWRCGECGQDQNTDSLLMMLQNSSVSHCRILCSWLVLGLCVATAKSRFSTGVSTFFFLECPLKLGKVTCVLVPQLEGEVEPHPSFQYPPPTHSSSVMGLTIHSSSEDFYLELVSNIGRQGCRKKENQQTATLQLFSGLP